MELSLTTKNKNWKFAISAAELIVVLAFLSGDFASVSAMKSAVNALYGEMVTGKRNGQSSLIHADRVTRQRAKDHPKRSH